MEQYEFLTKFPLGKYKSCHDITGHLSIVQMGFEIHDSHESQDRILGQELSTHI